MTNNHIHDRIQDYIDGALSVEETQSVRNHIASCADCAGELASMEALIGQIRQLPKEQAPPAGFFEDAGAALHTAMAHDRRNGHAPAPKGNIFSLATTFRWYAAAAVVLIAGLAIVVWNPFRTTGPVIANNQRGEGGTGKSSLSAEVAAPQTGTSQVTTQTEDRPLADNSSGLKYHKLKKEHSTGSTGEHTSGLIASKSGTSITQTEAAGAAVSKKAEQSAPILAQSAPVVAEQSMAVAASGAGESQKARVADVTTSETKDSKGGRTVRITGYVRDEKGEALPGALVKVRGTNRGAVTDPNGLFVILGLKPGIYTVDASLISYQTVSITGVNTDTLKSLAFALPSSSVAVNEVVVTANGLVNKHTTSSEKTVAAQSIQAIPNVKDVGDVITLQQGSGTTRAAGATAGGKNMFLRGGRANEVQYLTDGAPSNAPAEQDVLTYRYHDHKDREHRPVYNPPTYAPGTEEYKNFTENGFFDAAGTPLSTFSIDVDAASYTNIRRFLNNGQRPPTDAVRIEEMINYFKYSYPKPDGDRPFSVNTDIAECPWAPDHSLLLVGIQGRKIEPDRLPPSNLTFLIDVSGSMNEPTKLPLVKQAFKLLVSKLREQDRVSIVVYAGNAGLVLPSTSGENKQRILDAIDRLEAGGSTAGGAGIQLAYNVAKENFIDNGNNRVILATDGDFNVGVSSEKGLEDLITERRNDNIFLTVLGFGMGNIKDNKMQTLADKGNGNNFYIDNMQEAQRVFIGQMAGTLFTIAKDVKIQIEFNPANVKAYRLIGYEKRLLNKEDFNDDTKDAGELGAGHTVTALYEIVPPGASMDLPGVDPLKYSKTDSREEYTSDADSYKDELLTLKLRYKEPRSDRSQLITTTVKHGRVHEIDRASENLRFAAAVAEAGMVMRDSRYKQHSSFEDAIRLAGSAKGKDDDGYRSEFIRLLESNKSLYRDTDRYK